MPSSVFSDDFWASKPRTKHLESNESRVVNTTGRLLGWHYETYYRRKSFLELCLSSLERGVIAGNPLLPVKRERSVHQVRRFPELNPALFFWYSNKVSGAITIRLPRAYLIISSHGNKYLMICTSAKIEKWGMIHWVYGRECGQGHQRDVFRCECFRNF